jgi:hypothetical protein
LSALFSRGFQRFIFIRIIFLDFLFFNLQQSGRLAPVCKEGHGISSFDGIMADRKNDRGFLPLVE